MVKKTYKSEEVINYVGSKIDFNIIMQGEVIRSYSEKEKKGIKLYFIIIFLEKDLHQMKDY